MVINENLTATNEERAHIIEVFPVINDIKDEKLKNLVIETWARVLRESTYRDIRDVPNTSIELGGEEKLVDHISRSAKIVFSMADAFEEAYGVKINRDVLIADLVLHDVDKPVMYERKGDIVEATKLGKKIPHGNYGALVAFKVGVPKEIVAAILNHSHFVSKIDPDTLEDLIVRRGEHTAFEGYRIISGLPPLPPGISRYP